MSEQRQPKSSHVVPSLHPTSQEWGLKQAQQAPLWSDHRWREACASLGVKLGE